MKESRISPPLLLCALIAIYFALESVHLIGSHLEKDSVASFIVVDIFQYGLAYSIPFILGVRCRNAEGFEQRELFVWCALIFVISFICYVFNYGGPIRITPNFKTPPHSYYIVYGSSVSMILWLIKKRVSKWGFNRFIVFLGQNTIWIYLWHMPFVLVSNRVSDSWTIRYLFVYGTAIFMFLIQRSIVKRKNSDFARKYLLG